MKRLFLKMTAAAAVGALVGGCGGTDSGDDESPGTLIDVAGRSGEISALVPAARRAGLEAALSAAAAGLTVMAPSNEAWGLLSGQLGFNSIQAMIDALPPATLEAILRYHVLPTQLTREQLVAGGASQPTLLVQNGANVPLALDFSSGLQITDPVGREALGNLFNIVADNGLFHVIDRVLLPAGLLTVLQTVSSNPERFRGLISAFDRAPNVAGSVPPSVRATLNDSSAQLTLFAPLNEAFVPLAASLATLTSAQVDTVLRHHVLGQRVLSSQVPFGTPVATASGQTITILNNATPPAIATIDDSTSTNANIVAVDILCANGVVHVVDKVLVPTF
jgi:transforming growth factor-beta-induced protein